MARYCFYCGRELATGEKCSCRTGASTGSAASSSSAGQAGDKAKAKAKTSTPKGPSFWSRFQTQKTAARQPKRPAGTGFGSGKSVGRTILLAGMQQIGKYLARPVESIRQSVQYASTSRLLVFLLIHAGLGGVALLAVNHQGTLDLLMQLTVAGSADNPLLALLFLFFQGVGLTLTLDLVLILITHLALRYVFRAGFSFNRVAASFVPVIFYQALFLLLAIFSLTTIPVSSLMTLAAGLAIAAVALYLALRQLTNFEENRCFMLLAFILVVFTSVLATVLSLALPVFKVLLDQTLPL